MPRPHRSLVLRLLATCALLALVAAGVVHGAPGERIQTAAGGGSGGFGGDGGPATGALLTSPSDVAPLDGVTGGGGYLIADTSNHRIRRIDANGTIQTVAGAGPAAGATGGFAGDGLAPTDPAVRLNQPRGVSPLGTPGQGFLIADTGNNRIRAVVNGMMTTLAGNGQAGFGGDGDGAQIAQLNRPAGVAALPDGGYLIADTGNNRIRRVSASGIIATVAGTGPAAFTGDGGPATQAALNAPSDVAPLTGGGFLIADMGNNRVRRVTTDGRIATVVGAGPAGFGGDGGPAGKALLNAPEGVAALADGSIAIADAGGERVRLVGVDGTVRTLAGTGTAGFSGDGGDPALAQLSRPRAVAQDGARLLIADAFNHRIRSVAQGPAPVDDSLNPTPPLGVSPPVLGKSVVARPRLGTVLVRVPGSARFVPLESIANLPMGSELDVSDGSVVVFFATSPAGKRAKAIATGGRFVVGQPAQYDRGQRPGELALSGPLLGCAASPRDQVRGQSCARPRERDGQARPQTQGARAGADQDAWPLRRRDRPRNALEHDRPLRVAPAARHARGRLEGTRRGALVCACQNGARAGGQAVPGAGEAAVEGRRRHCTSATAMRSKRDSAPGATPPTRTSRAPAAPAPRDRAAWSARARARSLLAPARRAALC